LPPSLSCALDVGPVLNHRQPYHRQQSARLQQCHRHLFSRPLRPDGWRDLPQRQPIICDPPFSVLGMLGRVRTEAPSMPKPRNSQQSLSVVAAAVTPRKALCFGKMEPRCHCRWLGWLNVHQKTARKSRLAAPTFGPAMHWVMRRIQSEGSGSYGLTLFSDDPSTRRNSYLNFFQCSGWCLINNGRPLRDFLDCSNFVSNSHEQATIRALNGLAINNSFFLEEGPYLESEAWDHYRSRFPTVSSRGRCRSLWHWRGIIMEIFHQQQNWQFPVS